MSMFFTSDTHFGHERIIELCNRPFASVDEMNEGIIERWNSVVSPEDTVYHLGDVALGKIADSLPLVGRLNGFKILVTGNHDRLFSSYKPAHREKFQAEYEKVFDVVVGEAGTQEFFGSDGQFIRVVLSHFPYDGDSHGEDRYTEVRPVDKGGVPLVHGHTHGTETLTYSRLGTPQYHVGQDAHDYYPVPLETILEAFRGVEEFSVL